MGFAADWLALREPADGAARDGELRDRLVAWAAGQARLEIFDLGSGTGSTMRALAPLLPDHQRWTLFDIDPKLRAEAARLAAGSAHLAAVEAANLAADLEAVLAREPDVLTASALIDLCSAAWLDRLATALPARTAVYIALSYDGREAWLPDPPHEARALAAFRAHQEGDKGFGPALGPGAAPYLAEALEARGRTVLLRESPWRIAGDSPLARELARGGAEAVRDMGVLSPAEWSDWRAGRLAAETVTVDRKSVV